MQKETSSETVFSDSTHRVKIGIFDSGMGGTTIFHAIKSTLKTADYLYLADSKNCPYGEKSTAELQKIVEKNVQKLKEWGAEIIVIACNTATVKCIDFLRQKYPELKFVGTEPAIKLATNTTKKNILILATPGTIASERTHELLLKNQKPEQSITLLPCPGLADTIEHTLKFTQDYIPQPLEPTEKAIIHQKLAELLKNISAPDMIVLGCTHYSLIKSEIQHFFPKADIIDGNAGVARQVKRLVDNLYKNK
ncbi:MAG: glutamate racemase [Candidatus Saccharibacteria bacterium]|nr:glutamate racemase [Candidatus Saccharibacteria bacterium]